MVKRMVLLCCLWAGTAVAASSEQNTLDIQSLKASIEALQQRSEVLQDFDELNALDLEDLRDEVTRGFKMGGYADVAYIWESRPGKVNYQGGFRLQHLSLQPQRQVTDKVFFFSEIEFENAPFMLGGNSAGTTVLNDAKFFVEVMEIDIQITDELKVIIGRYFAPAGIWNIDNYPPFTTTQERPQHIRRIFPQVMDGIDLRGRLLVPESTWELHYDFLYGNGESFNTSPVPGNQAFFDGRGDHNGSKAYGLRLAIDGMLSNQVTLGVSAYTDQYAADDWKFPNAKKTAVGADIRAIFGHWDLQAEYAQAQYDGITSNDYDDQNNYAANTAKRILGGSKMKRVGYYAQLMYNTGDHSIGLRHDMLNVDDRVTHNDSVFNSFIYNYHMNEDIVFKFEHHLIEQLDSNNDKISYTNTWFTIVTAL